jgi:hypothetical protein
MDDLDELLSLSPPPPESAKLADLIGRDAARVQRRRRWLVRGRRVAVLVAVYGAGLASMWYLFPQPQAPQPQFVDRRPEPEPPAVVDPYRNDPPETLEKWAFLQSGAKRVDLYRRAGDAFLGRDDVQGALRCYRRALDGATAADLAIQADSDSWLLMSLKMARKKEKLDARVN